MTLSGCQINPIDVNFHLQKIQLTKTDAKRTRNEKYLPSCQLGLRGQTHVTKYDEIRAVVKIASYVFSKNIGQASFYLLEPAVNTALCRLCYNVFSNLKRTVTITKFVQSCLRVPWLTRTLSLYFY